GGWCPYCNLQLQQIQASLAEIEAAGGKVIAISPELPDQSMTTKEKHDLQFDVLSDVDNEVADLYNLTYTVPDYVVDHYDLSSKLNEHNGNDNQRLPLAVTYVINRNGVIEYAFLDADYKNRATPEEIITELQEIN
ncbi:MAG: peroxiredoxin-like family protein, partial [Pseudomonadota bacterium]